MKSKYSVSIMEEPSLPLSLLSSVLGWAGCVLTTATQICERQEGIEEEEQNAGVEGEEETVERRHRIFDVPSFSPFPVHRKDQVTQQVNGKGKGDPGRDRRAAGGGEGTREATRISEGRRRDENHLNVGKRLA